MTEETRIAVCEYLNGDITKDELLAEFDLEKCIICGLIMLNEDSQSYEQDVDNNKYCETCWEAR